MLGEADGAGRQGAVGCGRSGLCWAILVQTRVPLEVGRRSRSRLSERHELEKPERLDGVGLFTVLDLELK